VSSPSGSALLRVVAWGYAAGLLAWLLLGLLPVAVTDIGAVSDEVRALASSGGALAGPAAELLAPTMPMTGLTGVTLLQYAFSALNLVLGVLLLVRSWDQLVPRLLAVGLLGTAATFNLPSHEAFRLIGSPWPVSVLHFAFHIASGVCYLWAVALFPDGRLPRRVGLSGRPLFLAVLAVTAAVAAICWWSDFLLHPQFFVVFFGVLIPVTGVGAQALRLREPSASAENRRNARLLIGALLPALAVAVLWCVAQALSVTGIGGAPAANLAAGLPDLFPAVFAIVPVVLFVALVRYRIFGLDRLLSRVLVATVLLVATGLVYLAAVVTGGLLAAGGRWWTVLVMAAAAVALSWGWDIIRRWVNRIVFGQDLDPAAAMGTLISGLDLLRRADELDQLVAVVVRATRARRAQLWEAAGDGWSLLAGGDAAGLPVPAAPTLEAGRHWWIEYEGRRIGMLTVELAPGERLPSAQEDLLADLAEHAGLLLHNATLADHLERRVGRLAERAEQLRRTRRRMVAAQDRERFRLERNLHDGAQQTLVAAMIELRMAAAVGLPAGAGPLAAVRDSLRAGAGELHELASGGLPAGLRNGDLRDGLSAIVGPAEQAGFEVRLEVDLPAVVAGAQTVTGWSDVAVAIWYCCSEAVQNAVKHSGGRSISITVRADENGAEFTVADDGRGMPDPADGLGGLRSLDDRVAALGGVVTVESAPGAGTTVHGFIPPAIRRPATPVAARDA
jgi:signal transduction histidine kinase